MARRKNENHVEKVEALLKDLKSERFRQRLTQKQLARRAGVGVTTIQRMERGSELLQLRTLLTIAESLGCEMRAEPIVPWAIKNKVQTDTKLVVGEPIKDPCFLPKVAVNGIVWTFI